MTKKILIGIIILAIIGVAGFVGYKVYQNKKKEKEVIPAGEDKNTHTTETYEHKPAVVTNPIELDTAEIESTAVVLDEIFEPEVVISSVVINKQIPNIGRIQI